MARNTIGAAPFDVVLIDTDTSITEQQVRNALGKKNGVTLCVRSASGPQKRGGYFFHIQVAGLNYELLDFEGNLVDRLAAVTLLKFINHAAGRVFDNDMLSYCQSVVNFRQDQTADVTEV